jgi:hypothetical protein
VRSFEGEKLILILIMSEENVCCDNKLTFRKASERARERFKVTSEANGRAS